MALALTAHAQRRAPTTPTSRSHTLTPRAGEPVTLSFPGVTDASCMIKISTNVSAFSLEGGAQVQNGKLVLCPRQPWARSPRASR